MAHTKNKIRMAAGDRVFLTIAYVLLAQVTISGYRRVFQDDSIMTGYANTLFYTVVGTLIDMVVTVPCGFALAQRKVPGKNLFMAIFMFTMYFGGGMIPTFLLIKNLGLYNTRAVLLILGAFSCYNCIICRTFFASIPAEMGEAAAIDGCTPMRYFIQIVLPISQALLGVMVLYFAVGHWNSYFNAMIYLSDRSKYPLQVFLREILTKGQFAAEAIKSGAAFSEEEMIAMMKETETANLIKYCVIIVSTVPMMILYPFLQRFFTKGVMIGAVKG